MANPSYLAVRPQALVQKTLDLIRRSRLGFAGVTTVFVTTSDRFYQGLVSVTEPVQADPDTDMAEVARLAEISVPTTEESSGARAPKRRCASRATRGGSRGLWAALVGRRSRRRTGRY